MKYKFIVAILIIFVSTFCGACSCQQEEYLLGSWWWHKRIDADKYLDFAESNNVNEIYYYGGTLDDETRTFISKANSKDIDVYLLDGNKDWLLDSSELYQLVDDYIEYQSNYPDANFVGIHLDIEPHQLSDFDDNRYEYIYSLISLCYDLSVEYPTIKFDYDIPFWLNDQIEFNNETKEAYKHIIDIANRVFVMSYRDTAEKIYDIAKDEVDYAISKNKTLFLCVETNSDEGEQVSFLEDGKSVMYNEIDLLRGMIPDNFGVSIHYIETWYDLKD